MDITRRTLGATAAAAFASLPAASPARAAAPDLHQGFKTYPLIVGHRGASGERPESTLLAFRQAIAEGADVIEPDLVLTKDGHLVVRHENDISQTTDVASRPEFAARKATKVIDGQKITGWFTEDFTLAEIKTIRCRERLPQLRPQSAKFDGQEQIATYQQVIDLAKAESARLKRTIGTYPEMKHPTYFAGIGLPVEQRLADILKTNGLDRADSPVFVQCFEVAPLKTFKTLSNAPRIQLVSRGDGPADDTRVRYADMISASGLKAMATYATGVGPEWPMVIPTAPDGGLVGLPRNIHKNFQVWRHGENVWLCPTNRIGPIYQFTFENKAWRFDGPVGVLMPGNRVERLEDAGVAEPEDEARGIP